MRALVMLLALFFIITLDSSCGSLASNVSCLKNEREALIKFKGNLTNEANRLQSWAGKDCCTWKGVVCSSRTGHVMKLDLRNPITFDFGRYLTYSNYTAIFRINMLRGEISSLLELKHLSYLDLSGNNLSGVDFLGSLKSLRYLNLSSSNLVGKVPHNLGNLSRLQYLDLSKNDLVGPIPNTLARLTSLTVLDLSSNYLNGTMPFFLCNLSRLSVLKLNSNAFHRAIAGKMTRRVLLKGMPIFSAIARCQAHVVACLDKHQSGKISSDCLGACHWAIAGKMTRRVLLKACHDMRATPDNHRNNCPTGACQGMP